MDTYVFTDTNVSEILEYTTPEFTDMPAPYVTGDVQVFINNPTMLSNKSNE